MSKSSPKIQAIQVDQFMGLNTLDDPKNIDPSYSPYMVNMDITSTGKLQTRYGYETFCTIGAATGAQPKAPIRPFGQSRVLQC